MKRNNQGQRVSSSAAGGRKEPFWRNGLRNSIKDAGLHLSKTEQAVLIKDKYPKARHHYLILPKDNIEDLASLNKSHIPLLQHLHEFAESYVMSITSKEPKTTFKIGYHAVPSMSQLHLHAISQDFDSPSLKNKKHWNSFTTDFFIPANDILQELEKNGKIQIDPEKYQDILKTPLRCHVCKINLTNIPKLKEHIRQHQDG